MHLIKRRNFLAALGLGAGAHLLAPMHRQLVGEALGAELQRARLLLYITGGGFPGPKDGDPGYWPRPVASGGFTLDPSMAALEAHKGDLTFMESFYVPYDKYLHGNGFATSTLRPAEGEGEAAQPTGISFDRWIAKSIGSDTPILSLLLGTNEKDQGDNQYTMTADGPRAIVQPMLNPVRAFEEIFGGQVATSEVDKDAETRARRRLAQKKSVLDAVLGDVERMRRDLAGSERGKLDQYLTSIRDLESKLADLVAAQSGCRAPAKPAADVYAKGRHSPKKAVYTAMKAIATGALTCGLTRVVTFFAGEGALDFMPMDNNDKHCGSHQMWHGAGTNADHRRYYDFQFANMAEMRQVLASVGEGDGTVADNTLVMNLCANGGQHHNGHDRYFAMLLGSLGRRLQTGKYIRIPEKQRSLADVYLTVAHAFGIEAQSFGAAELDSQVVPGVLV